MQRKHIWHHPVIFLAICIAIMIGTRSSLFRSHWEVPDFTLAAFFLAGVYMRKYIYSIILLTGVVLIDFVSIKNGVSSWCVTPAYAYLVPTYLSLWWGGTHFRNLRISSIHQLLALIGIVFLCGTLAFWISTGSFYLFSGYYDSTVFVEKFYRAHYNFPKYLGSVFLYVSIFALATNFVQIISGSFGPSMQQLKKRN